MSNFKLQIYTQPSDVKAQIMKLTYKILDPFQDPAFENGWAHLRFALLVPDSTACLNLKHELGLRKLGFTTAVIDLGGN